MAEREPAAFPVPKLNNHAGMSERRYIEIAAMQALIISGWKQSNLVVAEARHYGELMIKN